ncbi:AMP-binding protein [Streptomyces lasalocidi]
MPTWWPRPCGPAFGAVTFEVWTTLTAGARLVGLGEGTVTDPGRFQDAVRAHGISVIFLTAARFNLIARERPAAFAPLRTVLFGGEACDPRRVREVLAAGAPERLLHVYGPNETPAVRHLAPGHRAHRGRPYDPGLPGRHR